MCFMRVKRTKVALGSLEKKLSPVTTLRKHVTLRVRSLFSSEGGWDKGDDVRDWMFCQKGQRNENILLRPTSYSSIRNEDNALQPVVMTNEPAPPGSSGADRLPLQEVIISPSRL